MKIVKINREIIKKWGSHIYINIYINLINLEVNHTKNV